MLNIPQVDTWWRRKCNGQRWLLRKVHSPFGDKHHVWIYLENSNKCYHIPLTQLLNRYEQIEGGITETYYELPK